MARKSNNSVIEQDDPIAAEAVGTLMETANSMAEHSQQIMEVYGESLPYDRTRVVHEARFYMAHSAEAMLEAGKRLIILKEHEPHGDFENIVREQLGIPERTAQRLMQSAAKYLSPKLQAKAPALALLGKTKLFDLITEDDEELAALADGGTVAGMTLDDIERMSSRELRKALRDAKDDKAAKETVAEANRKRIDDLQEQVSRIKVMPINEQIHALRTSASGYADAVEHSIRAQLSEAFGAVLELADETGIDQTDYLSSRLDLLDKALLHVRGIVGIERTALASNAPEWENV